MAATAEADQVPDYPLEVSMAAFADMVRILDALGNEDALAIFLYTQHGIKSSKEAIETLRLTQKRFYSRLKELLDNALVEKVDGEYRHTMLGSILLEMGLQMEGLLLNKEKLKIMGTVSQSTDLSDKERKELMQIFSIDVGGRSKEVTIIDSFEELVSITVKAINEAKKSVCLATQYIDNRVVDAGFKAVQRGVEAKVLVSEMDQISSAIRILFSLLTNPKQIAMLNNFLRSPEIQMRTVRLPYTFIIVDREKCIIEIKDQVKNDFKFAFFITDEKASRRMRDIYESFWENSEDLMGKLKL